MLLPAGSRLGRYEVLAHLGSGGMGDVYKARDTRLDKPVALKVIGRAYARDPASQQRFEQERRLTASLDHPHICRLLDAGREGDVEYLAMEYLDGESLARRLERGALPVGDAIGFAIEIAEALEHAHARGIVHRDLKPGNVFLTRTGAKVLDFGLAKLLRGDAPRLADARPADTAPLDATRPGSVVGSAPYMAPERLEGREADQRSDVFGFGLVLYEMLTGQRAFQGEFPLRAILSEEPPPMRLQDPRAGDLEWIVRRCLAKKPEDRWQSMADVHAVLRRLAGANLSAPPRASRRPAGIAAVTGGLLLAAALSWLALRRMPASDVPAPLAITVVPPPNGSFTPTEASVQTAQLALAPDGSSIAYVAAGADGVSRIWVRKLAAAVPEPVAGTEGASFPFWKPDGRAIGFFTSDALRRVDISGGSPHTVAAARGGRGGTWNAGGDILFAPDTTGTIVKVGADGGTPTEVTRLDDARGEFSHRWPQFLPDGRRFIYFARGKVNPTTNDGIYLTSLDGEPPRLVATTSVAGAVLPPNHLLFLDGDTLLARPMNFADGTPLGDAVPIAGGVGGSSNYYGAFSASQSGAIAYASTAMASDLVWLDRAGRPTGAPAVASGQLVDFRLSPDGNAVAIAELDGHTRSSDIFVVDLARGGRRHRITSSPATDASPVWSPDGRRLAFRSNRVGTHDIYLTEATGAGHERLLVQSALGKYPTSWSQDERIAFHTGSSDARWDVLVADVRRDGATEQLLASQFDEAQAQLSPDGRQVAYTSNTSGKYEVWVEPLGASGAPRQVSIKGGSDPRWRRDGHELYYLSPADQLYAVAVKTKGTDVDFGPPKLLFTIADVAVRPPYTSHYDASPDGNRFLVRQVKGSVRSAPLTVLLNWRSQRGG